MMLLFTLVYMRQKSSMHWHIIQHHKLNRDIHIKFISNNGNIKLLFTNWSYILFFAILRNVVSCNKHCLTLWIWRVRQNRNEVYESQNVSKTNWRCPGPRFKRPLFSSQGFCHPIGRHHLFLRLHLFDALHFFTQKLWNIIFHEKSHIIRSDKTLFIGVH